MSASKKPIQKTPRPSNCTAAAERRGSRADIARETAHAEITAKLARGQIHPHTAVRMLRAAFKNAFLTETNRNEQ